MSLEQEEEFDLEEEETVRPRKLSARCLYDIEQLDKTIAAMDRKLAQLKTIRFQQESAGKLKALPKTDE